MLPASATANSKRKSSAAICPGLVDDYFREWYIGIPDARGGRVHGPVPPQGEEDVCPVVSWPRTVRDLFVKQRKDADAVFSGAFGDQLFHPVAEGKKFFRKNKTNLVSSPLGHDPEKSSQAERRIFAVIPPGRIFKFKQHGRGRFEVFRVCRLQRGTRERGRSRKAR